MKKFILMAAVGILVSLGVNAQKHGYLNVQELLLSLPATEKANKDLEAYKKTFIDALSTMEKDYEAKVKDYQKNVKTMTEAVREMKEADIRSLEQRMTEYQQSSNDKIEKKQNDLLVPIYQNINKSIEEYAKTNNYDFIHTADAILYAKESENITKAMITKMGGKPRVNTTTGAAATGKP